MAAKRTFSESRSTLSEILLSDTRTSVFCCRVSIIIIGTLVSDELAAETKTTLLLLNKLISLHETLAGKLFTKH